MSRFTGYLSDTRTRENISCRNQQYKSLLKRIQGESKQASIRVQLLENFGYDPEMEEDKLTSKQEVNLLELLEQKWQLRFFLSGFELLNASFKICTRSSLFQNIIRESLFSFDPDKDAIKDISKVGLGCYVGQEHRAGYAWNFVPLTEKELKASPYAGGTEIPEVEDDSQEEVKPHLYLGRSEKEVLKERVEDLSDKLDKHKEIVADLVAKVAEGLLTSEEFANACGTNGPPAIIDPTFKSPRGYDNYYHPDKVEEYKIRKQNNPTAKIENPEFGRLPSGAIRSIPLREDNWNDPKNFVERRLKREASKYNTYNTTSKRMADRFKKDAQDWFDNGYSNPTTYLCKVCQKQMPFYDYYNNSMSRCKECRPKKAHTRDTTSDNYIKTRVATTFALTIKKALSKGNNKYIDTPNPDIWKDVQTILGYDKEQYLKHLEDNFEPWMDWSCWGRTRRNKDGKYWQVRHAKPRSTYTYRSMKTPEFKEIWALDNISPGEPNQKTE